MDLREWLKQFRDMHAAAKQGALDKEGLRDYLDGRNELARAMLAAQRISLQPGQMPRSALRVARALPLELEVHGRMRNHITMDVSSGGFATIVAEPQQLGQLLQFSLKLPGQAPVAGRAAVIEVIPRQGGSRCSFQFDNVGADDRERVEMLVFDALLEQLKT